MQGMILNKIQQPFLKDETFASLHPLPQSVGPLMVSSIPNQAREITKNNLSQ